MSRWAERLKSKYANAEIAEIAKTPPESPLEGSFGNSGNFGSGTLPESDAREAAYAEDATPPKRGPNPPAPGGLVQRLVAAGATVQTWSSGRGAMASIEAPAGIPAELVREAEALGWHIIPSDWPNDEAEHDSWLAGVPAAELGR